jgi:hypothetical protein
MQITTQQARLFDIPPPSFPAQGLAPRVRLVRPPKIARPKTDLFGSLPEVVFSTRFFSGSTARNDCSGIVAARLPLGVAATEMKSSVSFFQVRDYLRSGHSVFIDSGVFGNHMAREKAAAEGAPLPPPVRFEDVFAVYDQVTAGLPPEALSRLTLVMPDAIGQQHVTLQLIREHRAKILDYITSGVDVILPVQRGEMPAQWALREIAHILGTERFRAGVPSKAAAMSEAEVRTLRHPRFHVLGRAADGFPLRRRGYLLLEGNPEADLTCDANMVRPAYSAISALQREQSEQLGKTIAFSDAVDDTELIYAVLSLSNWMSAAEVTAVANLFGTLYGLQSATEWIAAHRADPLESFISVRHGEEAVDIWTTCLYQFGLPAVFRQRAKGAISAQTRVLEVRNTALAVAERFGE